MFVVSKNQAKAKADVLHKFLTEKGIDLPSSELLNAIARMTGHVDWNSLSTQFSEHAVNALLCDHEKQHAHDALDCALRTEETGSHGFGAETLIQVASGFWMATSAGDTTDYVRICDPLGREVVYWSEQEFAEDPTCVLGALARYLNRGRTDMMPNPLKNSADQVEVADKSAKGRKTKKRVGLSGLNWDYVTKLSLRAPGESKDDAEWRTYHDNCYEILEALDAEREGTAGEDVLKMLDEAANDVAIDWGDEYEQEGLDTSELRGIKYGPGTSWILKDGRILQFHRLEEI